MGVVHSLGCHVGCQLPNFRKPVRGRGARPAKERVRVCTSDARPIHSAANPTITTEYLKSQFGPNRSDSKKTLAPSRCQ